MFCSSASHLSPADRLTFEPVGVVIAAAGRGPVSVTAGLGLTAGQSDAPLT